MQQLAWVANMTRIVHLASGQRKKVDMKTSRTGDKWCSGGSNREVNGNVQTLYNYSCLYRNKSNHSKYFPRKHDLATEEWKIISFFKRNSCGLFQITSLFGKPAVWAARVAIGLADY